MTSLENQNSTVKMGFYLQAVSLRFSSKTPPEETLFCPILWFFWLLSHTKKNKHQWWKKYPELLPCKNAPLQVKSLPFKLTNRFFSLSSYYTVMLERGCSIYFCASKLSYREMALVNEHMLWTGIAALPKHSFTEVYQNRMNWDQLI